MKTPSLQKIQPRTPTADLFGRKEEKPLLWLYILLAVLILIFLILLLPIGIKASGAENLKLVLCIGFLKFRLYPQKPKKKKQKKSTKPAQKPKAEEKEESRNILKEKGLEWIVETVKKVANLAVGVLKDFFKRIIVKEFMLSIRVATGNAADTAVKYGYCCSAVYPAVGLITGTVKCESYGVDITPDFDENAESKIDFLLNIKIRLIWLVVLVIKHGLKGIQLLLDLKK